MEKKDKFKSRVFYDQIRDSLDDIENEDNMKEFSDLILAASEYWDSAVEDAEQHFEIEGKELNTLIMETPGLAFFYRTLFTDAQQTRIWLDTVHEAHSAERYKWYITDTDAKAEYGKVSTTDAKQFTTAEESVRLLADLIRVVADRQHQLENVVESFVSRGIALSQLKDLRVAGIEETWVRRS